MSTGSPFDAECPRLARPWAGPCGGVPPLAGVAAGDFEPAIEAGMAEQVAALERISRQDEPATFANTNVPYELSGRTLELALAVYETYTSGLSDDSVQEVERRVAPRLAAHADRIVQDERLCSRIAAVFARRDDFGLGPEQQRLAWLQHTDLVRAGTGSTRRPSATWPRSTPNSPRCTPRFHRTCSVMSPNRKST